MIEKRRNWFEWGLKVYLLIAVAALAIGAVGKSRVLIIVGGGLLSVLMLLGLVVWLAALHLRDRHRD